MIGRVREVLRLGLEGRGDVGLCWFGFHLC